MYAHLLCGNREIFVLPWETVPRAASGRPEAIADDERCEEVRLIDSTCEAGEQSPFGRWIVVRIAGAHQEGSWNRVTPGAAEFLILSQVLLRPDRYGRSRCFETSGTKKAPRHHIGLYPMMARSRAKRSAKACCLILT